MLKNTFCHIQGIGPKTENRLWHAGLLSWSDITPSFTIPFPAEERDPELFADRVATSLVVQVSVGQGMGDELVTSQGTQEPGAA